ncbi:MAG: hypothetical protein R3F62_01895 [Planctomycetota bacterium]
MNHLHWGAALLLAGCATTRDVPPATWSRAVAAARATVAARAGYDLELDEQPTRLIATWRQPVAELEDDWAATAFGLWGCDPWCRLELEREGAPTVAARVLEVDVLLWIVPRIGTNERAEERLLARFAAELARLTPEEDEAR